MASTPKSNEPLQGMGTEVLYGAESAVGRGVQFMKNVQNRMDICFDSRGSSIVIEVEAYRNGYIDIRKRGAKIRALTEITPGNIRYCKELMKIVDELRHLEGIKGGIAVNETEYMATTVLQEAKPLTQVIYSNVPEAVEQGQYIFETMWNKAMPAGQRIREIEEGIVHYETKLVQVPEEILKETAQMIRDSSEYSTCAVSDGLLYAYNHLFETVKDILDKVKRRDHGGYRWVTEINSKEIARVAKIFMEMGMQIRHIEHSPPLSFGVSDKQVGTTIDKLEGGQLNRNALFSNEPVYISHFASLFEEMWKNGIDARIRIKEIEQGVKPEVVETIRDTAEIQKRIFELLESARQELLILLSSANAFRRQDKIGATKLLIKAAQERGVKIRIMMPLDDHVPQIIESLKKCGRIYVRFIEEPMQTKVSVLIADKAISLAVELKDDTKESSLEAMGFATYSNSKPTVLSYASIFESLWNQTELYDHIRYLYDQLMAHDKLQQEFINIAAHELRTPVQPILGLAEMLRSQQPASASQDRLLGAIIRNAKRLLQLQEDILDVTRIESNLLKLDIKQFSLNQMLLQTIDDCRGQLDDSKVKLSYRFDEDVVVAADRNRIVQVISNLLSNALKFTKEGTVHVDTKNDNHTVIVRVKDSGTGIDPEIMPRLFVKFATKSEKGTGLGLFLSKSIVEAHGGRMWAENNRDGRGATFAFSLPVVHEKLKT